MLKEKNVFKKFLVMSLCVLMVLGSCMVAGANGDAVPYIYVSGAEAISFSPETYEYTLTVPYYNYGFPMPVVYAGEGALVTYPESVADGEVITVTKGDASYTLTIDTVGESLFANPGFENQFEGTWTGANCGIYPTGHNVATGEKSMLVLGTSGTRYHNAATRPQVEAGKTYLSSFMIRLASDIDINTCGAQISDSDRGPKVTQYTDTETFDNFVGSAYKWNEDGTVRDKGDGAASSPLTITTGWQRVNATVVPTETKAFMHHPLNWAANRPAYVIDNYYVNELMVAKVNVKDENGNTSLSYVTPTGEAETYQLKAEILNQLGNKAGLNDAVVSEWSIAGEIDATISSDGLLTVNSGASGSALVLAKVSFSGKTVYGIAPIYVGEEIDESSVELIDIKAGSLSVPNFDPKKVEYDYAVPYKYIENDFYSVAMPVVKCYTKDSGASVSVKYPNSVKDGKITITVSKGELEKVYTLNLKPVGTNYFVDGGFEEYKKAFENSGGSWYQSSKTSVKTETTNVYSGLQSMYIKNGNGYVAQYWQESAYRPTGAHPKAVAGHTYLTTGVVKTVQDASTIKWIYHSYYGASDSGRWCYTENGEKIANNSNGYANTGDWLRTYGTYKANGGETPYLHYAFNVAGEGYVDEHYWGDLTVAELNYTGDSKIIISDEAQVITLTSEILNAYGRKWGLENETVSYELVKPYEGVMISEDKLVIGENVKHGTVLVRLNVIPTFQSAQTVISPKVSNIVEITLAEAFDATTIKFSESTVKAGDIVASVNAINNTEEKIEAKLYCAVYEKIGDIEQLISVKAADAKAEIGAILDSYATVTVPNNTEKTYVVKAFLWKEDNVPALVSEEITQ